jgi:hypothetical protein
MSCSGEESIGEEGSTEGEDGTSSKNEEDGTSEKSSSKKAGASDKCHSTILSHSTNHDLS